MDLGNIQEKEEKNVKNTKINFSGEMQIKYGFHISSEREKIYILLFCARSKIVKCV